MRRLNVSNISCPHCNGKDFILGDTWGTAMYFPPRYVNGVNVNPDKNIYTTTCECCKCGKLFYVKNCGDEQKVLKEKGI